MKRKKGSVETLQYREKKRDELLGISCFDAFGVMEGSKKIAQPRNMKTLIESLELLRGVKKSESSHL